MRSTTLLTPELDIALVKYNQLNQSAGFEKKLREFEYGLNKFFTPSWDPLKMLETDAPLAFVEAAAKNDLTRLKQLIELSFVQNDAKYYALVAATQSGHNDVINFLLSLPEIEDVVTREINYDAKSRTGKKFRSLDFKDPQGLIGLEPRQRENRLYYLDNNLTGRLGLGEKPNLLIEAADAGRLDVITHLQRFHFVNHRLNHSYGYYVCLRAAEAGHLHVVDEMLKIEMVKNKVIRDDEMLRYAAMQGRLNVVSRLLELPIQISLELFKNAFQHGTAEVTERLLKVPQIDEMMKYSGDDRQIIRAVEECVFYACYTAQDKSRETASKMLQMLLKYPAVARIVKENENADNDSNPIWYVLQYMKKSEIKAAPSASPTYSPKLYTLPQAGGKKDNEPSDKPGLYLK